MKLFSFEKVAFKSRPAYKYLERSALLIPEQYKCKYHYTIVYLNYVLGCLSMTANPELRNPCNEVALWTTSPCLKVSLPRANTFTCIDTTLSINTNVSYMMCYSRRINIATLPALCRTRAPYKYTLYHLLWITMIYCNLHCIQPPQPPTRSGPVQNNAAI